MAIDSGKQSYCYGIRRVDVLQIVNVNAEGRSECFY